MAKLLISGIIEKMTHGDTDDRYMATCDLLYELNEDSFILDMELEMRLSSIILQQLDDVAIDVSRLAVKCLALLVKRVGEEQIVVMTSKLCDKLLKGMSTGIKCGCLEIMCDVVQRYGSFMADDHEKLLHTFLVQLSCNKAAVRKRTVKCIASLACSLSDDLLAKVTSEVVENLSNKHVESEITHTNIQMIGALCHAVGDRFGTHQGMVVPALINCCTSASENDKELPEYSLQVGAFSVLRELVVVLPDCLSDHIGSLVPTIERVLNDKSSTSNLKIEALVFTKLVLASHSPPVFHPYIEALSSSVLAAVGERYYKVTAEALSVCGELVRVVRPNTAGMGFDFKPFVHPLYNGVMSRLTMSCQDQDEVKECAITCMVLVISTFGDQLTAELSSCLPVLVDQLKNKTTRLTTVKAFAVIATSPLHIDLSCVLDHLNTELAELLEKANWVLGQATLGIMITLVTAYGDKIGSDAYEVIIVELSSLISAPYKPMTALALKLCCALMTGKNCSESISLAMQKKVLPQALTLVKSPWLQGQALLDLQKFFEALVYHANTSFYTLLDSLLSCTSPSPQSGGVQKEELCSIAQCVAVLCLATGDKNCSSTVKMLMEILKDDSGTNSAKKHLALLSLGEIGRRKDLSAHAGIETIIIESFQSPFEEIKSAASYALGNIAVGSLSNYLPFILNQIDKQEKQYFLLHSLKEVIVRQSTDIADFQNSSVENILALLFKHCESKEEGVRNVVAECLGKMALIEPEKLVPALLVRTTSPAAVTRATVATAVKYSVVERPEKLDEIIFPEISSFLMLIKDDDQHVRCAAVSALSTFARHKPNLIEGLLPQLLPLLYDQTVIKKELIRTVDLGPFKHVFDDGLELRKAAFECVFTLLEIDQVPTSSIVPYLKSGLKDHSDLKMLCHRILSLLADKCPATVLAVEEESQGLMSNFVEFGDEEVLDPGAVYARQLEEALMKLPGRASVTFHDDTCRSFDVNIDPHVLRIDVPLTFPESAPSVRCLTEFYRPYRQGSVFLDWAPGMTLHSVICKMFLLFANME